MSFFAMPCKCTILSTPDVNNWFVYRLKHVPWNPSLSKRLSFVESDLKSSAQIFTCILLLPPSSWHKVFLSKLSFFSLPQSRGGVVLLL